MRQSLLTLSIATAIALAGCSHSRQDDNAARQLGREAHHAADDIKRGAKEAAHEAREAGKNFREGWKEARHDPPPPPPPPRDDHRRDRRRIHSTKPLFTAETRRR